MVHPIVRSRLEAFVHVEGGNFPILTTGSLVVDRILSQRVKVLDVTRPNPASPKAALVHFVQGLEHDVHAGITQVDQILLRYVVHHFVSTGCRAGCRC
jgi:hypothetical protein